MNNNLLSTIKPVRPFTISLQECAYNKIYDQDFDLLFWPRFFLIFMMKAINNQAYKNYIINSKNNFKNHQDEKTDKAFGSK